MSIKIALAGNPNCGKTTLFNNLTGSNQYVGNWPGVTVEKKEGKLKGDKDVIIQDLPGIYSLSPYTLEEVVSRTYLVKEKPDAILNIIDGTNIERNLYLTIAKGYKSGGFNTQIFSDVLQQKMMNRMGIGEVYDVQRGVAYKPEYSWNYEIGGHFSCMEGAVRGDFALFYIDCRDQQLTVFPPGQTTGRMMTNAGRTRSLGAEAAVQISPWRTFDINLAYGYTDARFVRYETTVKNDDGDPVRISYKDNRIPYAPQLTLSAGAAWTVPTGVKWLGDLVFQAGVRCAGRIWWNEENTLSQPFYALTDASVRFEHARYSLSVWGRNLTDAGYDVFYFKSIGNEFVQRGRPRTFGITLNINL